MLLTEAVEGGSDRYGTSARGLEVAVSGAAHEAHGALRCRLRAVGREGDAGHAAVSFLRDRTKALYKELSSSGQGAKES